jgi:hypothetical protein
MSPLRPDNHFPSAISSLSECSGSATMAASTRNSTSTVADMASSCVFNASERLWQYSGRRDDRFWLTAQTRSRSTSTNCQPGRQFVPTMGNTRFSGFASSRSAQHASGELRPPSQSVPAHSWCAGAAKHGTWQQLACACRSDVSAARNITPRPRSVRGSRFASHSSSPCPRRSFSQPGKRQCSSIGSRISPSSFDRAQYRRVADASGNQFHQTGFCSFVHAWIPRPRGLSAKGLSSRNAHWHHWTR